MFAALKTGVAAGAGLTLLASIAGDVATEIVAITAGLTAVGWLWQKMVVPAAKNLQRTHEALGALEDLGLFMAETRVTVRAAQTVAAEAEQRANRLDARLDLIERHIGMFAAEDALRVREAIAIDVEQRRHSATQKDAT